MTLESGWQIHLFQNLFQVMVPFGKENLDGSYDGPDYLDEVESPQTDNQAMCLNDDSSIKSSSFGNWFHKATSFWTNGFWWYH